MSKPNHCHSISSSRTGSVTTSAIEEISAGIPKILRHSCHAKYEKFSSFSTWAVKGLTAMLAEKTTAYELECGDLHINVKTSTTSIESVPFAHQNSSEWCMVLTKQPDGLYLSFMLTKYEKTLRANLRAEEITPSGEKREVFPSKWSYMSSGQKTEQKLVRELGKATNEDEIILECEVCIECIAQDSLPVAEAVQPHIGVMKGLDDMFDKEVLTDFDLHARGTVLKAHRALLSVRSPYFAAMLQPHTKEAEEGRVEISDTTPEVLKQVLLYMYKGAAPALEDMPLELLIAADKYQLHELKGQCENFIAGCLTVDNAAESAANAKTFSCAVLWDRAVLYIKENLCEVMSTPGWRDIIITHPEAVQSISELMLA